MSKGPKSRFRTHPKMRSNKPATTSKEIIGQGYALLDSTIGIAGQRHDNILHLLALTSAIVIEGALQVDGTVNIDEEVDTHKNHIALIVRSLRDQRLADVPLFTPTMSGDNVISLGAHAQDKDQEAANTQLRSLVRKLVHELREWTGDDNAMMEAGLAGALSAITATTALNRREDVEIYIKATTERYSNEARRLVSYLRR